MSQLTSSEFWVAVLERALKTGAQVAAAAILVDGVVDVLALDWQHTASITIGAMLLSVLTSLGGLAATKTGPSLVRAEQLPGVPVPLSRAELEDRLRLLEQELAEARTGEATEG